LPRKGKIGKEREGRLAKKRIARRKKTRRLFDREHYDLISSSYSSIKEEGKEKKENGAVPLTECG